MEPERLVLSTRVTTGPAAVTGEALLTVTFAELGDRTEMTFHVSGLVPGEENAGLDSGWSSSFDRLAQQLAGDVPTSSGASR